MVVQQMVDYLANIVDKNAVAAYQAPSVGTTLPSSATNGQEAVLVDSISNPSYVWRFRYNGSSISAYKWEFIGGSPAAALVNTQEAPTTLNAWADLATIGPQITVPRAGDYDVCFGARKVYTVATSQHYMGLAITGKTTGNIQAAFPLWSGTSGNCDLRFVATATTHGDLTGLASGAVIKLTYYANAADPFAQRFLEVTPRRVS